MNIEGPFEIHLQRRIAELKGPMYKKMRKEIDEMLLEIEKEEAEREKNASS